MQCCEATAEERWCGKSARHVLWEPGAGDRLRRPGGMGNGALPNGPSYRAHPRLYQTGCRRSGRECPLCPDISDINLFRYCEGIIYFDAEVSDRAFDLWMSEEKLDGPQIAGPSVDQGSFCSPQ